jgi:uracil-DNA glycosylase family protein
MRTVAIAGQTDWGGWRAAARALALAGIAPDAVRWQVGGAGDALPAAVGGFGVSRALVAMAAEAFQARAPERFALLYRLIWRAHAGARAPAGAADPAADADADAVAARLLALAVRADAHRMRTHLRFLPVPEAGGTRYLGWYAPAHYVLEANAQLLARRFAALRWSVMTPDGAAHWDGAALRFGPPMPAPADDDGFARDWQRDGAAMLAASRPGTAIAEADALDEAPRPPDRAAIGPVIVAPASDPGLAEAAGESAACRRCALWQPATQTVFGEGPADARLLFVGEQPGDQEDIIGRPFVGPAGQLLDQALEEAGIDRRLVYVTNAVKHFKFIQRGKRRIHERPDVAEMTACRFWLDVERVRITPALTVMLGATAARTLLGRPVTIGRERGRPIALSATETGFVTVHPSFLLRVPDEATRAKEYRAFVDDLRAAARLAAAASTGPAVSSDG